VTDPATKKTTTHPGGEPAGFIIQIGERLHGLPHGRHGLFGDMKLIADYYKPHLLVPIRRPLRHGPQDAAYATKGVAQAEAFVIPITTGRFRCQGHAAGK